MKIIVKSRILISIIMVFLMSGCTSNQSFGPNNLKLLNLSNQVSQTNIVIEKIEAKNNYLALQAEIDKNLLVELKKDYKFIKPFVALNPYGNSPLSALIIFNTETKTKVRMTVLGHDISVNITHTFPTASQHILPIYGLYAGEKNSVEFILDDGSSKTVIIETAPLKSVLKKAKVLKKVPGKFADGLTFCDPSSTNSEIINTVAYDSNGDLRWYLKETGTSMPTKRLKNGRIISTTVNFIDGSYYHVGVREMDLIGKVYKQYVIAGGQHHDYYEMPNGNLIICNNNPNFSTREDIAYEIDRKTGRVVKTFDMKKIFNKSDGGSFNQNDKDWFHMNSVSYNKSTNTILFSGRNIDAVVGIDYTSLKLKWILGTSNGWSHIDKSKFLKPFGSNFEWQYAQHAAHFLPDGDILIFDNGSYRAKTTNASAKLPTSKSYSRGVRYSIDTKKMIVKQVWQFGKSRGSDWYSSYISDADYIGYRHYFLTSGALLTSSKIAKLCNTQGVKRNADIIEVKNDTVVFELLVNTLIYRSERMNPYTEKNTYDMNQRGAYLGNYGSIPSVTSIYFDKNSKLPVNFGLNVFKEYGRVIISGTWNSPTRPSVAYAVIYNQTTGKSFVKTISAISGGTPNQKFYAMISLVGLSGNYKLLIVAGGKTYNSKYIIHF